ncbi:MAG: thioesterase family protein, partial [Alphaproteobacteria bacterium]|nr:thioesterase family protein [Alphaproteobacteria bacterium]
MNSPTTDAAMPLTPAGPHRWTTVAGPEWSNPGGGLWGGYAIGLSIRVLDAEPTAIGEALSLTLTYAAALPSGPIDIRARCLRQGRSIGVWEVELLPGGSDQVGVHAIVTMAQRPTTPPFEFAKIPDAPAPETLPRLEFAETSHHYGASAFERRMIGGDFMPEPGGTDARSLAWVRPRRGPMDKAMLGMVTDFSPPRSMYALGRTINTTTLTLTVYLHATEEELAAIGDDFILIECDG